MINAASFYSANGELLVIPTTIGIDFYDAATLQKLSTIPSLSDEGVTLVPAYPRLVALSPDQSLLAASLYTVVFSADGDFQEDSTGKMALFLWSVTDGTLLQKIPVSSGSYITDLDFSPDGKVLAAGFDTGKVQLWNIADGQELYSVKGSQLEFSPDGSRLATMPNANEADQHMYAYNTVDGRLLKQWEGQRAIFSPDGLLAIENGGAVRVMDVEKGIVLRAFSGVSSAFSTDGQSLALLDQGRIKLYHVTDGSLIQTLAGDFESVFTLQFAPDGQTLAVVGEVPMCPNCQATPAAAIWQLSDGTQTTLDIQDPLWLTYAPQEGSLVIWNIASIHFLNPKDASTMAIFDEYATSVDGIAFSPDGQTLAANSGQPHLTARLWRVEDGQLTNILEDPSNSGYGNSKAAYSPDGQVLWAQGSFWHAGDGERLTNLEKALSAGAPPYVPASVAFSPDGRTLAIGYLEGNLQLWDLEEEKLIRKLEGYGGEVVSLAFSPDGNTLAAVFAYPDFTIQLWNVLEGERLLSIKGTEWTYEFTQAIFSPDGETLATVAKNEDGMDMGTVELWRASDGQRLIKLETTGVMCVTFSLDGRTIATGSYDHTVRLWQASDGALLQILRGHGDYINDLAFSPSGELLASGSYDGTVILWGIQRGP